MALLLLISGVILIVALLVFDNLRIRRKARSLQQSMNKTQSELDAQLVLEASTQQELTIMRAKLDRGLRDPITSLLGWQLFEDRLNQSIKESARYQLTMGVLLVDIDDFKVINDALSYEVGDALLKEVAKRLETCIRQVDSVSRFSKDTFVVLLNQLNKPETAAVVVQRILQTLAEPMQVKGHELYVTACVGIAIYPSDGQDAAALIRSADHALHLAKEKGSHLYQFYQERMHVKSQRELTLYTNLSRDSIFAEFVLYYQPIVNALTGEVVCMDALLHWQQPELGLIKPQEIFELAEKQRKLHIISEWLLRNACQQFLHWRSLGFSVELLGIPLFMKQLESSQFIYRISQILQELNFKPEWLMLEIKDNLSVTSFDVIEKALNMLQYMGVKIAIENFGRGSFSLCHLKNAAIHYLKLDSALIDDVDTNPKAVALVKSVVLMAQSLSMEVIVQGVDSAEQAEALKAAGCSWMQGGQLGGVISGHDVTIKIVPSVTQ